MNLLKKLPPHATIDRFWTTPQSLLRRMEMEKHDENTNRRTPLDEMRRTEDQRKLIRPTISKPQSEDNEDGDHTGRTFQQ
jgi:hypothetical protein